MSGERVPYTVAGAAVRETFTRARSAKLTLREHRLVEVVVELTGTYSKLEDDVYVGVIADRLGLPTKLTGRLLGRVSRAGVIRYTPARGRGNMSRIGIYPPEKGSRQDESVASPVAEEWESSGRSLSDGNGGSECDPHLGSESGPLGGEKGGQGRDPQPRRPSEEKAAAAELSHLLDRHGFRHDLRRELLTEPARALSIVRVVAARPNVGSVPAVTARIFRDGEWGSSVGPERRPVDRDSIVRNARAFVRRLAEHAAVLDREEVAEDVRRKFPSLTDDELDDVIRDWDDLRDPEPRPPAADPEPIAR